MSYLTLNFMLSGKLFALLNLKKKQINNLFIDLILKKTYVAV